MISKPIEQINIEDLKNLIDNSIPEGKSIDYKQSLPGGSDSDKKEFLADVSSFANTIGGYLIFGISEESGIPTSIPGVSIIDSDEVKLKYENIIRDGIEPRVQSDIRIIERENENPVVIIRISKSWNSPHRVIYKSHDKFYARNSAGKYPMDTMELRTAFTLSETIINKIRDFKINRTFEITSDNTPIPFIKGAKIILHLIPVDAFTPNTKYEIDALSRTPGKLRPIYSPSLSQRYNLDGLLSYSVENREMTHSYVQLYRNGIVEAVEGALLKGEDLQIPSIAYEKQILISFNEYLNLLQELNAGLPLFVFLTLTGVKGYEMIVNPIESPSETYFIDRDILNLPEAIIENYDVDPNKVIKPLFDLIWNACGFARSFNFDEEGNWRDR